MVLLEMLGWVGKFQARNKSKALAMLAGGKQPKQGSGLEVVVGDIRDRSSLTPSLFKVRYIHSIRFEKVAPRHTIMVEFGNMYVRL